MNQNRRAFLRNTALLSAAMQFPSLAFAESSQQQSAPAHPGTDPLLSVSPALVRQQFQLPPKKFRPIVRWWWPGNAVTEAELRREVGVLDQAGFGGAEIQAFAKALPMQYLSASEAREVNTFASPSFFEHVAAAVDEARQRGLFIDYTFGSGWPFGGGEAITPELASIELRSSHTAVTGPANLRKRLHVPAFVPRTTSNSRNSPGTLPDGWTERLKRRAKVVAVIAVRGSDPRWDFAHPDTPAQVLEHPGTLEMGTSLNLTSALEPDGTLTWDVPDGTWQIFVFSSVPTEQGVNGAAGQGPELVLDHMNAAAFAAHAQHVGENAVPLLGRYFGDGLRAIFCDSLEVKARLFWSDDFLVEFRRRRGYDLLPFLPILQVRSLDEPFGEHADFPLFDVRGVGDRVRHDYHQTVSDLMIERFYSQFDRWAHTHNLLSRTQAHGAPVDVLRVYGESDIPEAEDLYDDGTYDFLKMAASSAHVYGRSIVGSESFVWHNALYQTTPEKIKVAADELLTAGINSIAYHGFAYILPGVPAPGWHPFSGTLGSGRYSSQINELNPFWPYMAQLNAYITRVQYLSQIGRNIAAVALFRYDLAHGAQEQGPVPRLNQGIMDAGYNYDHLNLSSLLQCRVHERMLITTGGARYRALVFPPLDAMNPEMAEILLHFAASGLPILFASAPPEQADTFFEHARQSQRVQSAMRRLRGFRNVHVCAGAEELISALSRAATPNLRFRGDPLPFIQKQVGELNVFFVRNESDATRRLHVDFHSDGTPELWDPWTGRAVRLNVQRRATGWVQIDRELPPFSSALIVFAPSEPGSPSASAAGESSVLQVTALGTGGWKLMATGTDGNGKHVVVERDWISLMDWSADTQLRSFCGRGVYSTVFAAPRIDSGNRVLLDLGGVRDVAEVRINGKQVATLLLRPYQTDITEFLHPGENFLQVAVTNALFNSMVVRNPPAVPGAGTDEQTGPISAGLIGPVQLQILGEHRKN